EGGTSPGERIGFPGTRLAPALVMAEYPPPQARVKATLGSAGEVSAIAQQGPLRSGTFEQVSPIAGSAPAKDSSRSCRTSRWSGYARAVISNSATLGRRLAMAARRRIETEKRIATRERRHADESS